MKEKNIVQFILFTLAEQQGEVTHWFFLYPLTPSYLNFVTSVRSGRSRKLKTDLQHRASIVPTIRMLLVSFQQSRG